MLIYMSQMPAIHHLNLGPIEIYFQTAQNEQY